MFTAVSPIWSLKEIHPWHVPLQNESSLQTFHLSHHEPFLLAILLPKKPIKDFPPRSPLVLQYLALGARPSSASFPWSPARTSSSTEGPNSVTEAGAVCGKLTFRSKPPPVNGLSGLFFLSRSKLVLSMVRVNFLPNPFLASGDLVGDGDASVVSRTVLLGDFLFGDRGERETLEASSSMLSLVLTLRESPESLIAMLSETSDSLRGLCLSNVVALGGDRASESWTLKSSDDVPSIWSVTVSMYWRGDSMFEDDTELPKREEERYG